MFSDDVEFELGWNQGQDDAKNGIHCRFEEGHSQFAMGYFGGYMFELNIAQD